MKPNHFGAEEPAGMGHAFPTQMLPPPLRAMVLAMNAVHGVPEVMPAAIALAMISAAIRDGLRIASGKG